MFSSFVLIYWYSSMNAGLNDKTLVMLAVYPQRCQLDNENIKSFIIFVKPQSLV